jgi:hypothetical protein
LLFSSSGSFYDSVEGLRVVNSYFAQHFPIQGNFGFFTAVNEFAVPYAPLTACCAQSGNPQAPEVAFSEFSADSSVDCRPDTGFFCQPIQPASGTAMTFYCFEDSFFRLASCGAFSYSWHFSFPLKFIDS